MKRLLLSVLSVAAPLTALAHPGHPGHDFEWDFAPTLGAVVLFGLIVAGGHWLRRRRQTS